jgi:hypothetical protein
MNSSMSITFLINPHYIISKVSSTSRYHDFNVHVFCKFYTDLTSLKCQFSCWHNHKRCKIKYRIINYWYSSLFIEIRSHLLHRSESKLSFITENDGESNNELITSQSQVINTYLPLLKTLNLQTPKRSPSL